MIHRFLILCANTVKSANIVFTRIRPLMVISLQGKDKWWRWLQGNERFLSKIDYLFSFIEYFFQFSLYTGQKRSDGYGIKENHT